MEEADILLFEQVQVLDIDSASVSAGATAKAVLA